MSGSKCYKENWSQGRKEKAGWEERISCNKVRAGLSDIYVLIVWELQLEHNLRDRNFFHFGIPVLKQSSALSQK